MSLHHHRPHFHRGHQHVHPYINSVHHHPHYMHVTPLTIGIIVVVGLVVLGVIGIIIWFVTKSPSVSTSFSSSSSSTSTGGENVQAQKDVEEDLN